MFVAVLFLSVGAFAQEKLDDPERFRGDLRVYVQDLSRLSPAVVDRVYKKEFSLAEAEATIESLTHEELRLMEQNLRLVPFWREVPQMLAEKSLSDPALQQAAAPAPSPVAIDVEVLRRPMMSFVGSLRSMPKDLVSEEYQRRLDRIEATLAQLDAAQLVELQAALNERMPAWIEATNRRDATKLGTEAQASCTGSFPANILCELNAVFAEIAAIPNKVATFATDAVNFIGNELKKLFETIKDAIPTTPQGVMSLIGLGSSAYTSVVSGLPTIDPPCPSSVPGIGTVGDIRAMYVCQRGPEFLGRALFNIFPKDLWGMKPKIAAGLFYFPWTYLCGTCFGGTYERNEAQASIAHRNLLTSNLNAVASSLVDQATVNEVQAKVTNVDADVAVVEAKLDVLTTKTNEQLNRLDVEVTTRASEVSVDGGRAEALGVLEGVEMTISKLDVIDHEVVALIAEQNETASSLERFRKLAVRQRIEDDLIRNPTTDRIGLFETPQAQGGFLEMAIAIVEETLANRRAAGVDMASAGRDLQVAQADYGRGAFKSAYTSLRKAYQSAVK